MGRAAVACIDSGAFAINNPLMDDAVRESILFFHFYEGVTVIEVIPVAVAKANSNHSHYHKGFATEVIQVFPIDNDDKEEEPKKDPVLPGNISKLKVLSTNGHCLAGSIPYGMDEISSLFRVSVISLANNSHNQQSTSLRILRILVRDFSVPTRL